MHNQLTRIEYIHSKYIIHRDIKPENFCIGLLNESNLIYAIDFGLSKRYKNPKTGDHIPFRDKKSLTGTARYASLNTHLGFEQSRRDDLESIGYILLYFMRGNLPWQGMLGPNSKTKYTKITEKKTNISAEVLCEGFPVEFVTYFKYVKQLKFDEKPEYAYLRKLFKDAFYSMGFHTEAHFDWIQVQTQLKAQAQSSKDTTVHPSEIVIGEHESKEHINMPKEAKIQIKADVDKKRYKSSHELLHIVHYVSTVNTKDSLLELDEVPAEKDTMNVPNVTLCKKQKIIGSNKNVIM